MEARWLVADQHERAAEDDLDDHDHLAGAEEAPEPAARPDAPPAPGTVNSCGAAKSDREHPDYQVDQFHRLPRR